MSFVHLHTHSDYSKLDGAQKVDALVKKAVADGQNAVAVTDHGTMASLHHLHKSCKKAGIKPILGIEAYHVPDGRRITSSSEWNHLILLAQNQAGFRNIMEIHRLSWDNTFHKKPIVTDAMLEGRTEGVLSSTGCLSAHIPNMVKGLVHPNAGYTRDKAQAVIDSELSKKSIDWSRSNGRITELQSNFSISESDYDRVLEGTRRLAALFPEGHFFVEVQNHMILDQLLIEPVLIRLSNDLGLPLVATNDSHYLDEQDHETHDAILASGTGTTLHDESRFCFDGLGHWFRTTQEMREAFPDHIFPGAVDATQTIADMVEEFPLTDGTLKMPHYSNDPNKTDEELLEEAAYAGLRQRMAPEEPTQEYLDRLRYEIDTITRMGYAGYTLIVANDMVNWPRSQGVLVGAGRGSAAGSLVNFSLEISDPDPIKHHCQFERYLNPDRAAPPDVDTDVPSNVQPKVVEYLRQKYGAEHVSLIGTVGVQKPLSAIRGACRVVGMTQAYQNALANSWSDIKEPISIKDAVSPTSPDKDSPIYHPWRANGAFRAKIAELLEEEQTSSNPPEYGIQSIIAIAIAFEGKIKTYGAHPAGVIVTPEEVWRYCPVRKDDDGALVSEWNKYEVEDIGLVKFDLLSISALNVIQHAVDLVKESDPNFDIRSIPMDDPKVFEMLQQGETEGLFQLSGDGMTKDVIRISPETIDDISAIISVHRSGPMEIGVPEQYARAKNDGELLPVVHEEMRDILSDTYGTLVYQEQVMALSQHYAGYTAAQADNFRRAIGKKDYDLLMSQKEPFINGVLEKGYSNKVAHGLWELLPPFSEYSFNRCLWVQQEVRCADGYVRSVKAIHDEFHDPERDHDVRIMSMYPDGTVAPHTVSNVVRTGKKDVYKVTTESGAVAYITMNHRMLTTKGYLPLSDIKVGDELIFVPRVPTDKQRQARRENMLRLVNSPERKELDSRTSARMKKWQATRLPILTERMKKLHAERPDIRQNWFRAGANEVQRKLRTDPEFRANWCAKSSESIHRALSTGPGFGTTRVASNGMRCDSTPEWEMCEWLIANGVKFEFHKPIRDRYLCDFYFAGVYWEMDGLDRHISVFERKYGDLPFVVVTPEDYRMKIAEHLGMEHVENGDRIVSIEYHDAVHTMDIEMAPDGPKNFVLSSGLVSHNSHAISYAYNAYWGAYLKCHYPGEYAAACIDAGSTATLSGIRSQIEFARSMGVQVVPPNISKSSFGARVEGNRIFLGFSGVPHVGEGAIRKIVQGREGHVIGDILDAVSLCRLSAVQVQNLARVGAFEHLPGSRSRRGVYLKAEEIVAAAKAKEKAVFLDEDDMLFSGLNDTEKSYIEDLAIDRIEDWTDVQKAVEEIACLGFAIGAHPLESIRPLIEGCTATGFLPSGAGIVGDEALVPGEKVVVIGLVNAAKVKTSNNRTRLELTIESDTGIDQECIFFGYSSTPDVGSFAVVTGEVRGYDDRVDLIGSDLVVRSLKDFQTGARSSYVPEVRESKDEREARPSRRKPVAVEPGEETTPRRRRSVEKKGDDPAPVETASASPVVYRYRVRSLNEAAVPVVEAFMESIETAEKGRDTVTLVVGGDELVFTDINWTHDEEFARWKDTGGNRRSRR